jgi:hypothetical protein
MNDRGHYKARELIDERIERRGDHEKRGDDGDDEVDEGGRPKPDASSNERPLSS